MAHTSDPCKGKGLHQGPMVPTLDLRGLGSRLERAEGFESFGLEFGVSEFGVRSFAGVALQGPRFRVLEGFSRGL